MYYFLFTLYLAIACLLIIRIPFIKDSGLTSGLIWALFLVKIFAGLLLGWMSQKFYPQGNDYWGLNIAGLDEYRVLLSNPKRFIGDIFISPYPNGYAGFFDATGTYWNDLKNNLIIKLLACCNIFSRGNYYINSLFFNFIGFFGPVALYRVFADIFRQKKWLNICGCFLLPSTLYFTSGIHKDLVVFTMLGLFSYALYFSIQKKLTLPYFFSICITFFSLLLMRNFLAIAIVPAGIAFILTQRSRLNKPAIFILTYCVGFLILFSFQLLKPSFQPLKIISQRQRDFIDLPYAASQLNKQILEPTLTSLVKNTPEALNHSLLRPYLWEHPTIFLIPLAIELFIYQVLFGIMIIWHHKTNGQINAFILFGLFLTISMLLFTGYIVPNIGSIVRYRSIYLPFLLTPVLCSIKWKKTSFY